MDIEALKAAIDAVDDAVIVLIQDADGNTFGLDSVVIDAQTRLVTKERAYDYVLITNLEAGDFVIVSGVEYEVITAADPDPGETEALIYLARTSIAYEDRQDVAFEGTSHRFPIDARVKKYR